ncbi:Endoribonuclease L-PSP [Pelagimonas phthalicica]|uniref:Endoribonuclease L-PSP n=1 Tax=Pelagimonas phthalicica TaxID=1037362 RepID=A0A238J9Q6_9RHOB|nr:RidA family protein [Pelagimonas phthalicica]TDS94378.1 enamine deaminase RidA (YjgF/YER057c/UK114 family) [Pelagimonas phthalicica]SMX27095.1 Endoribonuclease L-PSP [Pelagimonas phthalicica]
MPNIETALKALGIELPDAPKPLGNFAPYLIDGTDLFISGQISIDPNGRVITGRLGEEVSIEQGQEAARCCAIGLLARAKGALRDLERIDRLVKLGAFVNAAPGFAAHPQVVNGASDLMVAALGAEKGTHVRFAVGSSSLPANAAVEIEAHFRIQA